MVILLELLCNLPIMGIYSKKLIIIKKQILSFKNKLFGKYLFTYIY